MKVTFLCALFASAVLGQSSTSSTAATASPSPSADEMKAVELFQSVFASLPVCGQTCFTKLPDYVAPIGLPLLKSLCANQVADLKIMQECVSQAGSCSQADTEQVNGILALIPTGCTALSPATSAASSAPASATTTTPVNTPKGNDASNILVGLVSVFFAFLAL
ncbi:UNVERIFIED_CONTAM: hypothetical protein HDU68_004492 [Siphonaria sp. JEL0065]|nr:hypothetical protein HDU68_004492 [Siphonaria sp. JEL0065]